MDTGQQILNLFPAMLVIKEKHKDDELRDLRIRVAVLEKENKELRTKLTEKENLLRDYNKLSRKKKK